MLAALVLPAIVISLWIAPSLGWAEASAYPEASGLVANPITRLFLFLLTSLSFFHWAHRFRYTLYDGLQLYHLNKLIATITYGMATAFTAIAAYILVSFGR
jgi:fumarate reductase subunit D